MIPGAGVEWGGGCQSNRIFQKRPSLVHPSLLTPNTAPSQHTPPTPPHRSLWPTPSSTRPPHDSQPARPCYWDSLTQGGAGCVTLASLAVTGHQRIWKEATCPVNPKGVPNKIKTVLSDAVMTLEVGRSSGSTLNPSEILYLIHP